MHSELGHVHVLGQGFDHVRRFDTVEAPHKADQARQASRSERKRLLNVCRYMSTDLRRVQGHRQIQRKGLSCRKHASYDAAASGRTNSRHSRAPLAHRPREHRSRPVACPPTEIRTQTLQTPARFWKRFQRKLCAQLAHDLHWANLPQQSAMRVQL